MNIDDHKKQAFGLTRITLDQLESIFHQHNSIEDQAGCPLIVSILLGRTPLDLHAAVKTFVLFQFVAQELKR